MTTFSPLGLPRTVRRIALLGLSAAVLSSCSQDSIDNPKTVSEENGSTIAQVQEPVEQAVAQPVTSDSAVDVEAIAVDLTEPLSEMPGEQTAQPDAADLGAEAGAIALDPAAELSEMPAAFQGLWDVNLETGCSGLSDGRLLVEPTRLEFYESAGKIVDIAVQGPTELLVTTEMSGEGETWTKTHNLQLSAGGGEVLTVNEASARFRCP